MDKEKPTQLEDLQQAGRTAADALRGYGYEDLAQEYERVLHRFAPDSKEVLAHSRIASTTLKEINQLTEERLGKSPALERSAEVQQRLEQALQPKSKPKALEELSFPARQYLETHSNPLEQAAEEVSRYLDAKNKYVEGQEANTKLHNNLNQQLASYRALPTAYNMERLEEHTRQGVGVMRSDYEQAKATQQKENEQYVADRNYLSSEGRALILSEAEKGEFDMPNRVKGNIVLSRANYAQEQLDQYRHVKDNIMDLDQDREASKPRSVSTLEKEYGHLSAQQQHYAALSTHRAVVAPTKEQEIEM